MSCLELLFRFLGIFRWVVIVFIPFGENVLDDDSDFYVRKTAKIPFGYRLVHFKAIHLFFSQFFPIFDGILGWIIFVSEAQMII